MISTITVYEFILSIFAITIYVKLYLLFSLDLYHIKFGTKGS